MRGMIKGGGGRGGIHGVAVQVCYEYSLNCSDRDGGAALKLDSASRAINARDERLHHPTHLLLRALAAIEEPLLPLR